MIRTTSLALLILFGVVQNVHAGMTGNAYMNDHPGGHIDGFGAVPFDGTIIDLWVEFDDIDDGMLNIYDFQDINLGTTYYQSFTGSTWLPNNLGAPFETPALKFADSFVSIGGDGGIQPSANGTGLDPLFGGSTAAGPQSYGGWYNSAPNTPIGAVVETAFTSTGYGVFIGRFSKNNSDPFSMVGSVGSTTWNQGLGTPGQQGSFTVIESSGEVPEPSTFSMLAFGCIAMAGYTRLRRRRK